MPAVPGISFWALLSARSTHRDRHEFRFFPTYFAFAANSATVNCPVPSLRLNCSLPSPDNNVHAALPESICEPAANEYDTR